MVRKIIYQDIEKNIALERDSSFLVLNYTSMINLINGNALKLSAKKKLYADIAEFFYKLLLNYNLPVNFVEKKNNYSIILQKCDIYPFYVKIKNFADSRTARIFNVKKNLQLNLPIVEFKYQENGEEIITESHILALNLIEPYDAKIIKRLASKANAVLKSFFERRNATLSEFALKFGKSGDKIYIIEDLTPSNVILEFENNYFKEEIFSNDSSAKNYIKFFTQILKNI